MKIIFLILGGHLGINKGVAFSGPILQGSGVAENSGPSGPPVSFPGRWSSPSINTTMKIIVQSNHTSV